MVVVGAGVVAGAAGASVGPDAVVPAVVSVPALSLPWLAALVCTGPDMLPTVVTLDVPLSVLPAVKSLVVSSPPPPLQASASAAGTRISARAIRAARAGTGESSASEGIEREYTRVTRAPAPSRELPGGR